MCVNNSKSCLFWIVYKIQRFFIEFSKIDMYMEIRDLKKDNSRKIFDFLVK